MAESNLKMVAITKERYDELIEDSMLLDALRSMGVDNWSGYSDAIEFMEAMGSYEDYYEEEDEN